MAADRKAWRTEGVGMGLRNALPPDPDCAEDARSSGGPVPAARTEALKVGLAVEVAALEERIRARVERMRASGCAATWATPVARAQFRRGATAPAAPGARPCP